MEALSWVELQGMNEDAALRKTLKQLRVEDRRAAVEASELLYAVSSRKNARSRSADPGVSEYRP